MIKKNLREKLIGYFVTGTYRHFQQLFRYISWLPDLSSEWV